VSCDLGPTRTDPNHGPALHALSSVPRSGQGLGCAKDDAECGVGVDTPIEFTFDRLLLPSTAVRQSIAVSSGPNVGGPFFSPQYDLLERRLTYVPSSELEHKALYRIRMPVAQSAVDYGLRAFDGAPLSAGVVPTQFSFATSDVRRKQAPTAPFAEPTCDDVSALLAAHCASGCCHGGASPAMGLRLDSSEGLAATAIGRVAHQSETGNTVGTPFSDPARFGVGMPIIFAGEPASSYLLYKLLLSPQNLEACQGPSCAFESLPGARNCVPLPSDERERLASWFVIGEAMPIVEAGLEGACLPPDNRPLHCGEMRALTRFIELGARCP
jgi:hypothetical protein